MGFVLRNYSFLQVWNFFFFFLLHDRTFTRSWAYTVIYQMRKGRRWLLGMVNSNMKCPFLTLLRGRCFTRNLPRVSKHTFTLEVKPWEKDDLEAAGGLVLGGFSLCPGFFGEWVAETLLWLNCSCQQRPQAGCFRAAEFWPTCFSKHKPGFGCRTTSFLISS